MYYPLNTILTVCLEKVYHLSNYSFFKLAKENIIIQMKSSRSAFMLVFYRESVGNINTLHVSTYFADLKVKISPGRSKFQSLWQML